MRDIEDLVTDRLVLGPSDADEDPALRRRHRHRQQTVASGAVPPQSGSEEGHSRGDAEPRPAAQQERLVGHNHAAAVNGKHKRNGGHWPGSRSDAIAISKNLLLDPDLDFEEDLREKVWDIVIIGAGVVGGAIARQLSRYPLSILVLEKSSDVAQGASKANSGIIHGGYDEEHGTVKSKVCYRGNRMFGDLNKELNFGFRELGALVVAFRSSASDPEERKMNDQASMDELRHLYANGKKNGVERLEIVDRERILELEPNVNPEAMAALYCPTVGIASPYEYCIALFENAVANGVTLLLEHEVTDIQRTSAGTSDQQPGSTFATDLAQAMRELNIPISPKRSYPELEDIAVADSSVARDMDEAFLRSGVFAQNATHEGFVVHTNRDEGAEYGFRCKVVINCAGLGSGDVAAMVGDAGFRIEPRKGEYILLDHTQGDAVRQVLFPLPDKKLGKGILVSQTYHRNLLLGPTSREMSEQLSNKEVLKMILRNARRTTTHFDPSEAITSYTGLRAKSSTKDFVVGPHPRCPHFVNVGGIDSPGLTSSPAIALMVEDILKATCGDVLDPEGKGDAWKERSEWVASRRAIIVKKDEEWDGKVDDPRGMDKNVICRCERVTEAEIVDAIHRPLPCYSTDAVKRRTRAGMGRCQGTFCEPRVASVIARELGVPVARIPRRGKGSSLLPNKRVTVQDMRELEKMAEEAEQPQGGTERAKL